MNQQKAGEADDAVRKPDEHAAAPNDGDVPVAEEDRKRLHKQDLYDQLAKNDRHRESLNESPG